MKTLPPLVAGDRVRHNYKFGHGVGTLIEIVGDPDRRFSHHVKWDNGQTFPYTYNEETQEIVKA